MSSCFALVDCNNFYVSCERVFNPRLRRQPVIVLSNNDGCIVARSDEVKSLGIPRGDPLFRWQEQVRQHHIQLCSSNYTLYGDMSRRVREALAQWVPRVEVYSIDEAFLGLEEGSRREARKYARFLRRKIRQWTGLPVSIGLGPTKTLAKLANRRAKQEPQWQGVLDLSDEADREGWLEQADVEEVWGIGSRHAARLRRCGIVNARQLRDASDHWIKKHLTITGLRTVWELRGVSCLPLEEAPPPKKSMVCARSFGRLVENREELREAVATYVARLAEKLRAQGSVASYLQVFLLTPRYRTDLPQYASGVAVPLAVPTAYTPALIGWAQRILDQLYRPGYHYQQIGVLLDGLMPREHVPLNLFDRSEPDPHRERRMQAIDQINARWGRGTIRFAAEGLGADWVMRQARRSPNYTTCWKELLVVQAG